MHDESNEDATAANYDINFIEGLLKATLGILLLLLHYIVNNFVLSNNSIVINAL